MLTTRHTPALALLTAFLTSTAVQAQTHHHHGAHQAAASAPETTTATGTATAAPDADPHAGHGSPQADAASASAPAPTPAAAVDHGQMQMQGGSAPADARDPHAYSNGLKLGQGDYAVPGVPRLALADEHRFASLRGESLERGFARKGDDSTSYSLQGWYGTTYDRLVVKAEGSWAQSKLQESRTELLWGHALDAYWDTQLGVRMDTGEGPNRQWLAFGVQGLAPYWFELDATAYLGSGGRTALRLEASYELLLTQRLILEPKVELHFYGKDDPARHMGSGLAEGSAGLRLRYEFSRQFAPYIGIERAGSFGKTADYVRAGGGQARQTRAVAGLRFWF
ncbi:MAG: copper resistance protein B [Acidovorax sp.]|jgi:copper resistance protein B|nr:copper resistance protein B [Acidovorax sp.]